MADKKTPELLPVAEFYKEFKARYGPVLDALGRDD
jgi:hypothetical protein